MARRGIDLAAVRASRARLDALAREHPELRGPSTRDDWQATLEESEAMTKTTQTAFRLPDDLIDRLDRYVERLNEEQPGMTFTRANVVRMLLTKGLDAVDGGAKKKRAKK